MPEKLKDKVCDFIDSNYGIATDFSNLVIDIPHKRIDVSDYSLGVSKKEKLVEIGSITIELASNTNIITLVKNETIINKVFVSNLNYDMLAPALGEASATFKIPSIPTNEIIVDGVIVNTEYGKFNFSNKGAYLKKFGDNALIIVDVPNGPFGINAKLKADINIENGNASLTVKLNHKNLTDCEAIKPFLTLKNVVFESGNLESRISYNGNIVNRINNPLTDIENLLNNELEGFISIDNANLNLFGLNYKGKFNIEKVDSTTWTASVDGKLASGDVRIYADWLGNNNNLSAFASNFDLKGIKLSKKNFKDFGVPDANFNPGTIDLNGELNGDCKTISGYGSLYANDWFINNRKIKNANANWVLDDKLQLAIIGLLDSYIGKLSASSTISLSGDNKYEGLLEGNIKDVQLKEIGSLLNLPLDGKCSGPFDLKYDLTDFGRAEFDMILSLDNGCFYDFKTKKITASVSAAGMNWNINNPHVLLYNTGEILTDGYISNNGIELEAKIINADLQSFGIKKDVGSGTCNINASVLGNLEEPDVDGYLWSNDIVVMDMPINSVKTEFHIKKDILGVAPLVIRPVDGSIIDGYTTINLKNARIESARINFQQLCLDLFRPFIPQTIASKGLDGVFKGYATYNRNNGKNYFDFLLEGMNILVGGQEIDSIYAEASSNNNLTELKSFFVRGFGGRINVSGHAKGTDSFNGVLVGENICLDRIEALNEVIPNIKGVVDVQGDLNWSSKLKEGIFNVYAKNIKTNERDLGNFGCEVVIDNEKLLLKNGEFDELKIKLNGDIFWDKNMPYNGQIDLNNVDLSFIPQAHGLDAFVNDSIIIDGKCNIQGELASPSPDYAELKLKSLRIKKDDDIIVSNKPIEMIYQNGNFELRSFELKYKVGIISAQGILSKDKKISALITGDNFSAKALGSLFKANMLDYDGEVSLNARIFGNLENPEYSTELIAKNVVVEERLIPEIKANVVGTKDILNVENTYVKFKNSCFDLKGSVDLINFIPNTLKLNLNIPTTSISDVAEYMPKNVKEAIGTLTADLNITGKASNPEVTGDLHLFADRISIQRMKKPLKNLVLIVTTNNMITNVDNMSVEIGDGTLKGNGSIDFLNASGSLDLHLKAVNLDLPLENMEFSDASATFDVSGDVYNPVVKGFIYLPKSKINLTTNLIPEKTESNNLLNSLKYDIAVVIPKNFWVKNPFLNAELQGDIGICGDLENFKLDGGVNTIQGKIYFKQRQFKIDTGEIKFGGVDNSFDPFINVRSEGQIQSTKIFLTLRGFLSNFKPTVYSTPPMSEGDIIAMLTLGRDLNSAMKSDTKELFENEVLEGLKNSYISALIGDKISEALNLDELYLSSMYDQKSGKSKQYVRVGKYISDNFFMAYEGTMEDEKDEKYIFEYRLPKGFIISVEFEQPDNEQQYGLKYDWKFW